MAKLVSDKPEDWELYEMDMQKKYEHDKEVFNNWCSHDCGGCDKDWCDCPADPNYFDSNLVCDDNGVVREKRR